MRDDYASEYARLYREHWWWRAREETLVGVLRGLKLPGGREVLDVGCGDGLFFDRLGAFGRVRGIEVDEGLLSADGPHRDRISTRPLGDPVYDDAAWRFDLITALDVIEHIEDDRSAVSALAGMLRPGGFLLVTVPAFPSLWDHHDDVNRHVRRYTAASLRRVLSGLGLNLLRVRYLFPSLFLPKLAVRWVNRGGAPKVVQHTLPPRPVNGLLARLCVLEDRLLRGLPVPFGTSVLALARQEGLSRPARPARVKVKGAGPDGPERGRWSRGETADVGRSVAFRDRPGFTERSTR
jgi:SAM-dependent methyltransferase